MSNFDKIQKSRETPNMKNVRTHSSIYSNKGPTSLMEGVVSPEGMQYVLIAAMVDNQDNKGAYSRAIRQGGRPVPSDRHPELALPENIYDPFGTMKKDIIEFNGLILMEFPKDVYDQFNRDCEMETARSHQYVSQSFSDQAGVPTKVNIQNDHLRRF